MFRPNMEILEWLRDKLMMNWDLTIRVFHVYYAQTDLAQRTMSVVEQIGEVFCNF